MERIRAILETDEIIPERADAIDPRNIKGEIVFEHVAFALPMTIPVLTTSAFTSSQVRW